MNVLTDSANRLESCGMAADQNASSCLLECSSGAAAPETFSFTYYPLAMTQAIFCMTPLTFLPFCYVGLLIQQTSML